MYTKQISNASISLTLLLLRKQYGRTIVINRFKASKFDLIATFVVQCIILSCKNESRNQTRDNELKLHIIFILSEFILYFGSITSLLIHGLEQSAAKYCCSFRCKMIYLQHNSILSCCCSKGKIIKTQRKSARYGYIQLI